MKSYMDLVYTTEGHPRHKLDLFLPADSKEAKSPLLVLDAWRELGQR